MRNKLSIFFSVVNKIYIKTQQADTAKRVFDAIKKLSGGRFGGPRKK